MIALVAMHVLTGRSGHRSSRHGGGTGWGHGLGIRRPWAPAEAETTTVRSAA